MAFCKGLITGMAFLGRFRAQLHEAVVFATVEVKIGENESK
jgi:hypothetical protein